MITTESNSTTIHIEDGQQVFPCRCGKTHRGFHAENDFRMHDCFHEDALVMLDLDWALCGDCGEAFGLEDKRIKWQ